MFQMMNQVFGRSMSRRGGRKKSGRRARLQVEGLEERQLLSHYMDTGELVHDESLVSSTALDLSVPQIILPLDLTTVAKEFPPHSGATTLFLNFDGAHNVAAFVSTTGNRDLDIQEILYRTSELFAPFNVQVRRISGVSNYSQVNGNTTIFIGDNNNVANTAGYTPWKHMDAPIQARAEDHQPNSDPWNYAYVDPIHNADPSKNYDNLRIAKVAAHEAGHTFGLLHTRTVGQDPADLSSSSANPPEVMAYDSSSTYEHFQNANYWITIRNRSSSGGTYLEEDLKATWHGETIMAQNSYTYLQAVLGARAADDAANVVHRDYTNGRALVDPSYTDSPLATVGPGTSLYDVINRQGDYDVYQLGAPSGVNYSLSIGAIPATYYSYVDTILMVYDNADGRLVAFNSSATSLGSQITFRRELGHTYMVVVGGNNGNSAGVFRLSIANIIPSPQNIGSLSTTTTTTTTTSTTDPADYSKTALYVHGTTGADQIVLRPANMNGTAVKVIVNGVNRGVFRPTGHIYVYGKGGNDVIRMESRTINGVLVRVAVPTVVDAGLGNDLVHMGGSKANNILLGGAGRDDITGGRGRDLIIGGQGADVLRGRGGADLLIGNRTAFDANQDALIALMAEWGRTDVTYQERMDHLLGFAANGLNGTFELQPAAILDDAAVDTLYGEAGRDWFIRRKSTAKDKVLDAVQGEAITVV